MKKIKLTQGKFAIVDDDIFDFLNQFKWYANFDGRNYYARKSMNVRFGKIKKQLTIRMHHLVIGYPLHKKQIDHINHNGLDNRRSNLRMVTCRENAWNQRRQSNGKVSSRFPGVYWNKGNSRWCSQIRINGERVELGIFKNELEAAFTYLRRLKQHEAEREEG